MVVTTPHPEPAPGVVASPLLAERDGLRTGLGLLLEAVRGDSLPVGLVDDMLAHAHVLSTRLSLVANDLSVISTHDLVAAPRGR